MRNQEYYDNNWYCLTQCQYPSGDWRLTQHSFDSDGEITTTHVAEGHHDSLLDITKGVLDVFYPDKENDPVFVH